LCLSFFGRGFNREGNGVLLHKGEGSDVYRWRRNMSTRRFWSVSFQRWVCISLRIKHFRRCEQTNLIEPSPVELSLDR
jgi:hypothetical protein